MSAIVERALASSQGLLTAWLGAPNTCSAHRLRLRKIVVEVFGSNPVMLRTYVFVLIPDVDVGLLVCP